MENWSAHWPFLVNGSNGHDGTEELPHPCSEPLRDANSMDAGVIASFVVLGLINVLVICGNTLVIMAVFVHSKLRAVTNLFIVSLAVADLLVGLAVLPFSTAYEVLDVWLFGSVWCKVWLAVDVWLCTASILNLCVISLDRYLAVTRPVSYPNLMTSRRAKALILAVWCVSFIICLPGLVGGNDMGTMFTSDPIPPSITAPATSSNGFDHRTESSTLKNQKATNSTSSTWNYSDEFGNGTDLWNSSNVSGRASPGRGSCQCQLISDRGYRIYAALGSFYLPMLVMMFFYWRIYRAAIETTRAINQGFKTTTMGGRFEEQRLTLRIHRGRSSADFYSSSGDSVKSNGTCGCHNTSSSFKQKESKSSSSARTLKNLRTSVTFPPSGCRKFRAPKRNKGEVSDSTTSKQSAQHQWLLMNHGSGRSTTTTNSVVSEDGTVSQRSSTDSNAEQAMIGSASGGAGGAGASGSGAVISRMGKRNIKAQVKRFRTETKAAKTLGIIVGGFILCWLPFFTIYLVGAFCSEGCIPDSLFSVFFWLGYCNSAINPCVYALFSRDFRYAFKKILCKCTLREEVSIKERIVTMFPPALHLSSFVEESEGGSDSH